MPCSRPSKVRIANWLVDLPGFTYRDEGPYDSTAQKNSKETSQGVGKKLTLEIKGLLKIRIWRSIWLLLRNLTVGKRTMGCVGYF